MKELPLNGFNDSISTKLSDRNCINFIPRVSDNGATSSLSLFPTVGRTKLFDPDVLKAGDNTNINTSLKVKSNVVQWSPILPYACYVKDQQFNQVGDNLFGKSVSGIELLEDSSGNKPNGGRARVAVSPLSAAVVMYDLDSDLEDEYKVQYIANGAVPSFQENSSLLVDVWDVAYFGGRFLYCSFNASAPIVYYSSLTSPDADPLDFISPDSNTEILKGIEVLGNTLYVFAETKTYMYQTTTDVTLPYRFIGSIDIGLYQPESKVATAAGIYMVGKSSSGNYSAYLINGGSYKKISNQAIDYNLSLNTLYDSSFPLPYPSDISFPDYIPVFKISDNSEDVIVFRSPSGCFCFSETTGLWHKRKTDGRDDWDCVGYGISTNGPVFISDTWIDNGDGTYDTNISEPNRKSGLELGSLMVREVTSAPFNANNDRMVVSELEPMCEADYSEPVTGWVDAKVKLSMSYDFGNTFESERALSVGKVGEYNARTRFLGVGYVDQSFVVKISVVNPYPVRVLKILSRTTKGYS